MTYQAKPGTVPYRAIAHLQTLERGAEVMTAPLAAAIRYDSPGSLTAVLAPARVAELIFARQKGGHPKSPLFWSLVDHSKLPASALQPIVDAMPRTKRTRLQTDYSEGRDSQQVLKAEPATADATDRETSAVASPGVGPTGAGQAADAAPVADANVQQSQYLPRGTMRRPAPMRPNTEQRYSTEVESADARVEAITLTVRVANLHQAERVLQLVREMAA